jgi:hypothetical protein
MPGYIKKKLQEYKHLLLGRIQNCPYSPEPKQFGSDAQAPLMPDKTALLDARGIKRIQQIVGSILYYARTVDMTILMALSSIAVEQTKATEKNDGTLRPTARLPCKQFGGESKISRVGHGNEYTLRRVIPFQNESAQQSLRTFFHGMDATKWRADQIEWCILCKQDHLTICGGVSGRSQAGRSLPQLSGQYNFLANINQPWASPAKKCRYIAIMHPPLVS